jgi:hypothetical protein
MKVFLIHVIPGLLVLLSGLGLSCRTPDVGNPQVIHRLPRIEPDYTGTVIPPNIAPLNFVIQESGYQYHVDVGGPGENTVEINSDKPDIRIPISQWKELLGRSKGKEIYFVVAVRDSLNQWVRYDTIRNQVARENIDPYLVYRRMPPLYMQWKRMGIFQRNIENFDEEQILDNKPLNNGCFNCHSFLQNSPDTWIIHLRIAPSTGMLLHRNGKTVLVKTQTEFNKAPAGHPAWHPSGRYIACSVYKVKQFFHSEGVNRDALDLTSDIILYNVDSNTVTASQSIADTNRFETYPAWSPDGKWLYFCSTARFDTTETFKDHNYKNVKYDLMRIGFDPETATFGTLETFLSSTETGKSITFPRFSPDGRYLLFTMSAYGQFPLARSNGDLYIMELQSKQIRKLACNSDRSDSYHSWSSNGRWFVFSSRRDDGITARPYFSYFDEQGNDHKAFILPQENPALYESLLETFNIPELVTGPIPESPQNLIRIVRATDQSLKARFVPPRDGH